MSANTKPANPTDVAESWTQAYVGGGASDPRTESSADYPTNAGTDVLFAATTTEPNQDQWYLAICKTNAITASVDGAPTCPGGSWAIA